MIKRYRNIAKQGLLVAIFFLLGLSILTVGCGKKEAPEEGKTAVAAEKKESGHNEKMAEHGFVTLSQEMQKSSGIEVKPVAREEAAVPLTATAVIEMNMDRTAKISPRVTGKAVKIIVSQGDRVKAGQALAYLDSVELNQIWADYRKAQGKVELARRSLQREETLFQKKISPEKDVLKARQELDEAEADINFAKERFRLVGVDVTQFASNKGNGNHPLVPVTSPVGGIVIEKTVTQGEVVSPEKTLFLVADLSKLWVVIDVYEKDMSPSSSPFLSSDFRMKVPLTAITSPSLSPTVTSRLFPSDLPVEISLLLNLSGETRTKTKRALPSICTASSGTAMSRSPTTFLASIRTDANIPGLSRPPALSMVTRAFSVLVFSSTTSAI